MTNQVSDKLMGGAVVLHYYITASPDQTDHSKQLEYDYPWVEDTVEPFTSNYDMLGKMGVCMCECICVYGVCVCVCVCVCVTNRPDSKNFLYQVCKL